MTEWTAQLVEDGEHHAAMLLRDGCPIGAIECHDDSDQVDLLVWDLNDETATTFLDSPILTEALLGVSEP